MTIEHGIQSEGTKQQVAQPSPRTNSTIQGDAPPSNLAALLDRFTEGVTNPANETVGGFAANLEALHAELVMLAHHFGAGSEAVPEHIDLDDVFPDQSSFACEPDANGIAADEALEHTCRELSRT